MTTPTPTPTPTVSIVMATYRRPLQLANTLESIISQHAPSTEVIVVEDGANNDLTADVCRVYAQDGVRYLCRIHRPDLAFSNPAVPMNIGIRAAKGAVIILQGAECQHVGAVICPLADRVCVSPNRAVIAAVAGINQDGVQDIWLTHSTNPRPLFFCGAIHRDHLYAIRGFDEDYLHAGWDDNDLAARLLRRSVEFTWADDVLVQHQWHEHGASGDLALINERMYQAKSAAMDRGEISEVRNLDGDWGSINA
jgi:GT2 family glycosyltransferase